MGLTITDILSEYGSYYIKSKQAQKDIIKKLKQPSVTESYFSETPTDDTKIRKSSADMSRVLQRYQKAFTAIGDLTFKPREIDLNDVKIDSKITPRDLQNSWLGFLAEKGIDPTTMPIVKYYMQHLIEQSKEDLENNEVFAGERDTVTPGTATAAGESVDGIRTKIRAAVTAGTWNDYALGAVPTTAIEVVEYIEDFVGNIPRLVKNDIDHIFMNEDTRDLFLDGMRQKYNTNYMAEGDETKVRHSRATVVGLPSMTGSGMIWATPKWNRLKTRKNGSQAQVFDVQKVDREVKFLTDFWIGIGFWINEYGYCNDQDLS